MGKKSKAGTDKKNKGPKGKRARAKAKLERQWGEETNEELGSHKRAGRSRLLSRSRNVIHTPPPVDCDASEDNDGVETLVPKQTDKSDTDSDDGIDAEEMDLDNGGAFSKLLQTILKTDKDSHSSESEDESNSKIQEKVMDESDEDTGSEGDNDDSSADSEEYADFDPFGARFSKEALQEGESVQEKMIKQLHVSLAPQTEQFKWFERSCSSRKARQWRAVMKERRTVYTSKR